MPLVKRIVRVDFEFSNGDVIFPVEAEVEVLGDDYTCSHHDCHDVSDGLWEAICRKAEEVAMLADEEGHKLSPQEQEAEDRAMAAEARADDERADAKLEKAWLIRWNEQARYGENYD